jgi:hypothetical protein
MRAAELAGQNPRDVIQAAVRQRSLADAADIAAVIDAASGSASAR